MPFDCKLQAPTQGEIKGPFGLWPFMFLNKFFTGRRTPLGPKWANVIDQNLTSGSPPNLFTDELRMDGNSAPFALYINKPIRYKWQRYVENDVLVYENETNTKDLASRWNRDLATQPLPLLFSQAEADLAKATNGYWIIKLVEVFE